VPKILMARPPRDAEEHKKIRKLARARHAPADWIERAKIIVWSWEGQRVPQIAATLGCHAKKVRRWLHRFTTEGLDGLGNRPGVGRKPRITQAERSALIALGRSDPPGRPVRDQTGGEPAAADAQGPPEWTLDSLTAAARDAGIDIRRSQLRRILRAEGVRWRRTRSWGRSHDPEFAPKGRPSCSSTPARRRAPR
jgi:transposase